MAVNETTLQKAAQIERGGGEDPRPRVPPQRFPLRASVELHLGHGRDSKEVGLVYDIADFDGETAALLRTELERKYYAPTVASIDSLKERYGFSYWRVTLTDGRSLSFTMQDTFRNIVKRGEDSLILLDVDGNRFVIESVAALDRKSYRRIELYL